MKEKEENCPYRKAYGCHPERCSYCYPESMKRELDKKYYDKAFSQHRLNGFRIKFPNGNGLSTIWSYGSYSENYNLPEIKDALERFEIHLGSNTVEIMPNCSDELLKQLQEKYPNNENGSVFADLSLNQWIEIVNILKDAPPPSKGDKMK